MKIFKCDISSAPAAQSKVLNPSFRMKVKILKEHSGGFQRLSGNLANVFTWVSSGWELYTACKHTTVYCVTHTLCRGRERTEERNTVKTHGQGDRRRVKRPGTADSHYVGFGPLGLCVQSEHWLHSLLSSKDSKCSTLFIHWYWSV